MVGRWRQRAAAALATAPAVALLGLVLAYGVNLVFWDQWNVSELFVRLGDGSLSFEHLFAQHNESRMVFPRLAFLALGLATGWDVRAEMLLTFALACLVALNLWRLARATLRREPWEAALVAAVLNLLVFSPAQYENWLWGFQIVVFLPVATITSAYALAYSRVATGTALVASMALAVVATYSMANGMLAWVLIPPVLAASRWEELRGRVGRLAVAWGAVASLAIAAFFRGYARPAHHPPLAVALENPAGAVRYFLAFLGGFLRQHHPDSERALAWPIPIGAALLSAFVLLVASLASRWRTAGLPRRAAPWVALGLYTVASAATTTVGRLGFGERQALDSRYVGFSVYLAVAVAGLTVLRLDLPARAAPGWRRACARAGPWLAAASLVALVGLHLRAGRLAVEAMRYMHDVRRSGVACQQFAVVLDEPWLASRFTWLPLPDLRERLRRLNGLGLLGPGLVEDTSVAPLAAAEPARGFLDRVERLADGRWSAEGWAVLPRRHGRELADAVLFTYLDGEGRERVFSMTDSRADRPDVAAHLGRSRYRRAGFRGVLARVPDGAAVVRAWAYDASARRAYRVPGEHRVR